MQRKARRRRAKKEFFYDYTLLFIVLFLVCFGLIMLYSVSSYEANLKFGDPAYYLKKQIFATVIGVGVMVAANLIDYHKWERFATLGYVVSIVMIFLVLSPMGREFNGARRWIYFGSISVQPAEVAKIALILLVSVMICKMGRGVSTGKGFWLIMGIAAVPTALILFITSNLSSAIIVMGIAVLMCFVADPKYKKFVLAALVVIAVAAIAVSWIVSSTQGAAGTGNYRFDRVLAWLDPEAFADDEGFQTLQALYAIGSGGIWGKGLGQSMQKLGFLPEAQNDMVFSIICEELGLFGAFCVILLFIMLIWRFMFIANNAPDLFGALLVVGVMAHFAIQVILNIAVVTNTIPNTGITLPFISYGGTSIVFLLAEIGLVLNVASQIQIYD
ncbi:MAG: cell division protein FtsW [Lachnospiraceae bacterium]|nr:cell division protein FtsW [Lachnospiraceae bacterium]